MNMHYALIGGEIIEIEDVQEWAFLFEHGDRVIKQEDVGKGYRVSTVFLGLDHSFGEGPPVLFETMVFSDEEDNPLNQEMRRYCTLEEAEEGHQAVVEMVRGHLEIVTLPTKETSDNQ